MYRVTVIIDIDKKRPNTGDTLQVLQSKLNDMLDLHKSVSPEVWEQCIPVIEELQLSIKVMLRS